MQLQHNPRLVDLTTLHFAGWLTGAPAIAAFVLNPVGLLGDIGLAWGFGAGFATVALSISLPWKDPPFLRLLGILASLSGPAIANLMTDGWRRRTSQSPGTSARFFAAFGACAGFLSSLLSPWMLRKFPESLPMIGVAACGGACVALIYFIMRRPDQDPR